MASGILLHKTLLTSGFGASDLDVLTSTVQMHGEKKALASIWTTRSFLRAVDCQFINELRNKRAFIFYWDRRA